MTREEAIERIMARFDKWALDNEDMKAIQTLIPKFRESEDERMRKAALEGIEHLERNLGWDAIGDIDILDVKEYLEKQKEQKPMESISHLTVQGNGVYKICPHCKSRMIRDDSKVYTSIPPKYGYNCPKCGAMEFDTVIYDNPEMEEQKSAEWSDEDERKLQKCIKIVERWEDDHDIAYSPYSNLLKSLRPQSSVELVKQMARSFGCYLDKHRPDGKMCLSNSEWIDLEKSFIDADWGKILRYANKYSKKKDLDAEIKKYTERLYNETFGNGQGTFDEFDWDDVASVIEDTARYFYNPHPHWKTSEELPNVDFKIEERKWVNDAVDNIFPEDGDFMSEVDFRKILKDTANHFAEWGAEHLKK